MEARRIFSTSTLLYDGMEPKIEEATDPWTCRLPNGEPVSGPPLILSLDASETARGVVRARRRPDRGLMPGRFRWPTKSFHVVQEFPAAWELGEWDHCISCSLRQEFAISADLCLRVRGKDEALTTLSHDRDFLNCSLICFSFLSFSLASMPWGSESAFRRRMETYDI